MHFGMFMEFGFRNGGSAQQAFREGFDLVDAFEERQPVGGGIGWWCRQSVANLSLQISL